MIITLAGRRIDADDPNVSRFSPTMKDTVRERLSDLFTSRDATALVCSGACGADLLALDAAGELGMRRRMVLPFELERFRETSVTDRSEPAWWGRLFDRIIDTLPSQDLVILDDAGRGTSPYVATNEAILDEAARLAREAAPSTGRDELDSVLGVIVWEGKSRGENDITEGFADAARNRGMEVVDVSTR